MKRLLQFCLFWLFAFSCSSSGDEPAPTPPLEPNITLSTQSAEPGAIVLAQANVPLDVQENTLIEVGGVEVQAIQIDSDKVAFILPVLPAGKVMIDYTNTGIVKQLELTIPAYTPITDPDAVATAFTTELGEIATHLDAYVSDPITKLDAGYTELLRHNQQLLGEEFAKLSAEDKLAVAYILRGNMLNDADFTFTKPDPSLYAKQILESPDQALVEKGIEFTGYVIIMGAATGVGLKSVMAPTGLSQVAGIGLLGVGIGSFAKAKSCAVQIGSLYSIPDNFFGFSSQRVSGSLYQEDQLVLPKDKSKLLSFEANYRHLIKNDPNASATTINNIFSNVAKVEKSYNDLIYGVNKIKNLFSSSIPDVPAYVNPIRTTKTTKVFSLNGSRISVKNISDPAIKLEVSNSATGITLKASSTTLEADKAFSFDVVYTDSRLGVSISKKISALYQVPQPHAMTLLYGNEQSGGLNMQLAEPLIVTVTNVDGQALEGVEVEWRVKAGGGSLSAAKSITDVQGAAMVYWTLGSGDPQEVEAFIKKSDGTYISGAPVLFKATTADEIMKTWHAYEVYFDGSDKNMYGGYHEQYYESEHCSGYWNTYSWTISGFLLDFLPYSQFNLLESITENYREVDSACDKYSDNYQYYDSQDTGTYSYDKVNKIIKLSIGSEYALLKVVSLTETELVVETAGGSANSPSVFNDFTFSGGHQVSLVKFRIE